MEGLIKYDRKVEFYWLKREIYKNCIKILWLNGCYEYCIKCKWFVLFFIENKNRRDWSLVKFDFVWGDGKGFLFRR